MDQARAIPELDVALLLSGGIDSLSLLFSLLEAGKRVRAYTFTLDAHVSSDFAAARRAASTFDVPFVPVWLPVGIDRLKADLRELKALGAKRKTAFECFWPMLHAYRAVEEPVVVSGMGADGHFCISKKGLLHFRDRIDEFRLGLYRSPTYAQQDLHARFAARLGKRAVLPFLAESMRSEFLGTTWREVNTPKQKQPILDAFPNYFRRVRVRPHTNLQLGDSRIATHFQRLLKTDWNIGGFKSVVGIYNALVAGRLP